MEKQPPQSQSKAIAPVDELCRALDRLAPDFQNLLPANVTPEKFVRTLKTAIRTNPKLVACSRQSLFGEAMKCAGDGLLPDGREAALVPFGREEPVAKYMPMVAGICKRARNSGEIATIDALVVYEKDTYDAWVDEKGPHFKHSKARGADRGKPVLTYAYALTKDGGLYMEEIDEKQMDVIKAMALKKAGSGDTPWKGPFEDEMRRKTAMHRLCKYRLPSSADMEGVLGRDEDLYDKQSGDGEPEKKQESNKPNKTAAIIEGQIVTPEGGKSVEPEQAESDGDGEQIPI